MYGYTRELASDLAISSGELRVMTERDIYTESDGNRDA